VEINAKNDKGSSGLEHEQTRVSGETDLSIDPAGMFYHLKLMSDDAEEGFIYRRRIEWLREFGGLCPSFPDTPEHHLCTLEEWDQMRKLEILRLTHSQTCNGT
jgi:hypothetical protein